MRLAPLTGMKVPALSVVWVCLLVSACVGRTERDDSTAEGPARRQLGEDVFMSGSDVRLTQASNGDIVVAGGNVAVASPVAGDAVLAGGALELKGPVGGDVYAAGGRIKLDAKVAGHTRAAGGSNRRDTRQRFEGRRQHCSRRSRN